MFIHAYLLVESAIVSISFGVKNKLKKSSAVVRDLVWILSRWHPGSRDGLNMGRVEGSLSSFSKHSWGVFILSHGFGCFATHFGLFAGGLQVVDNLFAGCRSLLSEAADVDDNGKCVDTTGTGETTFIVVGLMPFLSTIGIGASPTSSAINVAWMLLSSADKEVVLGCCPGLN